MKKVHFTGLCGKEDQMVDFNLNKITIKI